MVVGESVAELVAVVGFAIVVGCVVGTVVGSFAFNCKTAKRLCQSKNNRYQCELPQKLSVGSGLMIRLSRTDVSLCITATNVLFSSSVVITPSARLSECVGMVENLFHML